MAKMVKNFWKNLCSRFLTRRNPHTRDHVLAVQKGNMETSMVTAAVVDRDIALAHLVMSGTVSFTMITDPIVTILPAAEPTVNVPDPLRHAHTKTNRVNLQIVTHAALRPPLSPLMAIQEIAMHEIKGW